MKLKCPKCKTETTYTETNPYRPFCSKRCQDMDFIDWSDGRYAIPGQTVEIDVENNQNESTSDSNATNSPNKSNLH